MLADSGFDADSLLELIYDFYASGQSVNTDEAKRELEIIDTHTKGLPFREQDAVSSAVFSLCVQHERAAFMDGLHTGAALVLALMRKA